MKIQFIGAGVIATLYGQAFVAKGHSVQHYVRTSSVEKYQSPVQFQVHDERTKKNNTTHYQRSLNTHLNTSADLTIVCVKHYQIVDILPLLAGTQNQTVLFFGNNWNALDTIVRAIGRDRIFFGMPRAGGAIIGNILDGGLTKQVVLGKSDKAEYKKIVELFTSADFSITAIDKMQDWYFTHLATTVAWIAGAAKARGFTPFSQSYSAIKEAIYIGRETLEICKAKGIDPTVCADAKVFLLPASIAALITKIVLRQPMTQKISGGHGSYAPDELKKICYDVIAMGRSLHVPIPLLESYTKYIDEIQEI